MRLCSITGFLGEEEAHRGTAIVIITVNRCGGFNFKWIEIKPIVIDSLDSDLLVAYLIVMDE